MTNKVGKRIFGVYVGASAIKSNNSNLTVKERSAYDKAVNLVQVPHDIVHIHDNKVRLLMMSSLKEAHPHVIHSTVIDNGVISAGKINKQIYHRLDSILDPLDETYAFHAAVRAFEEQNGLLGVGQPAGIGANKVWEAWIEERIGLTEYNYSIRFLKNTYLDKSDSSGKTAIPRQETSLPLRELVEKGLIQGRILHAGAGRQDNPDRLLLKEYGTSVDYDPSFSPETRSLIGKHDFDTVVSLYVLNTLIPEQRQFALQDAAMSIKMGGQAYIAVRGIGQVNEKFGWPKFKDGFITSKLTFQKGYTAAGLQQEMVQYFKQISVIRDTTNYVMLCGEMPFDKS